MSVHTYIGARYVPRFMGTYDPTQIYEALDVVDNGLGTSYISKKATPAGTPLTDTDHWAIYGASSEAIINLQNQIDDMQDGSIPGSLQDQINTNAGDIGTLQTDLGTAQGDITSLQNSVTNIAAKYQHEMFDKDFLFVGDSYEVTQNTLTQASNFINCKSKVIKAKTACAFAKQNDNTLTYMYLLTTEDPLTTSQKNKITSVVFAPAGANDDVTNQNDIADAMQAMDTWLRANLPNLREIFLLPDGWCNGTESIQTRSRRNLAVYSHTAATLGWKYIDCTRIMRSAMYLNPSDTSGYHPDATGGLYIAQCIALSILTGSCDWEKCYPVNQYVFTPSFDAQYGSPTVTMPADGKATFNGAIEADGTINMHLSELVFEISNITIPANATHVDVLLTPDVANHDPVPVGKYILYPMPTFAAARHAALIKFANGQLKLRIWVDSQPTARTETLRVLSSHIRIVN